MTRESHSVKLDSNGGLDRLRDVGMTIDTGPPPAFEP